MNTLDKTITLGSLYDRRAELCEAIGRIDDLIRKLREFLEIEPDEVLGEDGSEYQNEEPRVSDGTLLPENLERASRRVEEAAKRRERTRAKMRSDREKMLEEAIGRRAKNKRLSKTTEREIVSRYNNALRAAIFVGMTRVRGGDSIEALADQYDVTPNYVGELVRERRQSLLQRHRARKMAG